MPRLFVSLTCCLALLLMTACAPGVPFGGDGRELSYADGAFRASVRGTLCRTVPDGYTGDPVLVGEGRTNAPWTVAADVSVTAPDGAGCRTVTVTYTAPDSLRGLTVTRSSAAGGDGSLTVTDTVTLGSVTITDTEGLYTRLLLPALSLLPAGNVTDVTHDADGRRVLTVHAEDVIFVYTCMDGSRLPVSVVVTGSGFTADFSVTEAAAE